jgi:hypothetical protein
MLCTPYCRPLSVVICLATCLHVFIFAAILAAVLPLCLQWPSAFFLLGQPHEGLSARGLGASYFGPGDFDGRLLSPVPETVALEVCEFTGQREADHQGPPPPPTLSLCVIYLSLGSKKPRVQVMEDGPRRHAHSASIIIGVPVPKSRS